MSTIMTMNLAHEVPSTQDSRQSVSQSSPPWTLGATFPTSSVPALSPSRKRPRLAESHDVPPWECDPVSGIVHTSGCMTCRSYISHMTEAKAAAEPTIQRALKQLEKQMDTYFFDGLQEGRRQQQATDQARIEELERALNGATSRIASFEMQWHDVTEQLRATRQPFIGPHQQLVPQEQTRDARRFGSLSDQLPAMSTAANFPAPCLASNSAAIPESSSISRLPTSEAPHSRPSNLPPRPTKEVIASSGALQSRSLSASAASISIENPRNLRQLQHLMAQAHRPGHEDHLAKVKMLCAEAHNTPREEKTELHRYILSNWRNPEQASSYSPGSAAAPNGEHLPPAAHGASTLMGRNNPRIDDPVEVWHEFLCTYPGSWPRGVRKVADGSPHLGDLKASRVVARLRPTLGSHGDSTARGEFMTCTVQMFASPGMYKDLLRRNSISVASSLTYSAYNSSNIGPTAVARHFATAGITVDWAVMHLEPWAYEYQMAVSNPPEASSHRSSRSTSTKPSSSSTSKSYHDHRRPPTRPFHDSKNHDRGRETSRQRRNSFEEDRFGWR